VLEIRLHGRGGQGAQVACQVLATAFFKAGHWVQAFAAYGGERRGAPVTAFLRVDDRPIRLRSDIERPRFVLVLDPTMLGDPGVTAGLREDGLLLVNALEVPPGAPSGPWQLLAVDAGSAARAAGLGPIVSTAMAGAFAGATGLLPLSVLEEAVSEASPARTAENLAACREAYLLAAGAGVLGA
jgi:2-oxoacid:acceptor oxidoreductase gamma subunit (pyruvate/2-ketoisovalerate family)